MQDNIKQINLNKKNFKYTRNQTQFRYLVFSPLIIKFPEAITNKSQSKIKFFNKNYRKLNKKGHIKAEYKKRKEFIHKRRLAKYKNISRKHRIKKHINKKYSIKYVI